MAEKVRIYQLARDLGIETKELLAMLDDMGVEYKSHSSTLEVDVAEAVRGLASETAPSAPATEAPEPEAAPATPAVAPTPDATAKKGGGRRGRTAPCRSGRPSSP